MRPNIVLIVLDTARADVFEPYGAVPGSSPVIADLAARGSVARSMIAPSGWTLPSHASLFTGLEARDAGLARAPGRNPAGCRPVLEQHRDRLLPVVLGRSGYTTAAVSCNGWVNRLSGFDLGFDRFDEPTGGRSLEMGKCGLRPNLRWRIDALRSRADDGAEEALRSLEDLLAQQGEAPFFWFANLVECHSPYLPPTPYSAPSPLTRLRVADLCRRHYTMSGVWRNCLRGLELDDGDLDLLFQMYRNSIRQLDDWVGRLLEVMERPGRLDDTMIIITSDHGEAFGEGDRLAHAFSLDDCLIKIPFISAGPNAPELDRVSSLREVPRLIAASIGLDRHPWHDDHLKDGIAVSQIDAPADRDERAEQLIDEWDLDDLTVERLLHSHTAVIDDTYKLVRVGRREALTRTGDPTTPLDPALAPAPLRRELERAARPTTRSLPDAGEVKPMDAELEARMQVLGYL